MANAKSAWGEKETQYFFALTPDKVLSAVESSGVKLNGLCLQLNSFENRVYELELDLDNPPQTAEERVAARRVVKFYRPGRWSREQILEEHQFLADIAAQEIPVISPLPFADGKTLHQMSDEGLYYTIFPKVGGRAPDELDSEQRHQLGRLLGRIHNVGAAAKAQHRVQLSPETYGESNLQFLLKQNWIPDSWAARYETAATEIIEIARQQFVDVELIRLHGDCHMGNLLWNRQQAFFLDFDDMVVGPAMQDIWLLITEEGAAGKVQLEEILEGYEEMRPFDRSTLQLVEVLRSLRYVHYTAWLARRWKDPIFPASFTTFNTPKYWEEKTGDLEDQLRKIKYPDGGGPTVDYGEPEDWPPKF